jgi:hypothetical protein
VRHLERAIADRDARLAAAERELQAHVAAAERELLLRMADKDARLAAAERKLQARMADKDALLAEKDAHMKTRILLAAFELAASKHEADVAKGILSERGLVGLFEACVADIWRRCGPVPRGTARVPTTQKLAQVLSASASCCPGLIAYLQLAAADNGHPEEEVLRQARKLCETLSSARVHADSVEGTTRPPAQVIANTDGPAAVALAALVRFTGRDIWLYSEDAASLPLRLRLRLPPWSCPCDATVEQLQRAPLVGPRRSL